MVAAPSINIKRVMSKPDQVNMPDDKRSRGDLDGNEATLAAVEQLSLDDDDEGFFHTDDMTGEEMFFFP